jgi:Domain of unknown function (DUF4845)
MRNKQTGMTMVGILFVGMLVVFAALVAMRMAPVYMEYGSVVKVLKTMSNDPDLKTMSIREVRDSFDRRATIDNITSVKGEDLDVSKDGGEVVVEATWSAKKPIIGNVSVVMDFTASTEKGN